MSAEGIKIASGVFSYIQIEKEKLFRMGSNNANRILSKQDLLLAQMLTKMNDEVKDDFCAITTEPDKFMKDHI